jgi:hypothetical protein
MIQEIMSISTDQEHLVLMQSNNISKARLADNNFLQEKTHLLKT